jgi:hypothetical protein
MRTKQALNLFINQLEERMAEVLLSWNHKRTVCHS